MVLPSLKKASEIREILKVHVDPDRGPSKIIDTPSGSFTALPPEHDIFHPEGIMAIEDSLPSPNKRWTFFHTEFHYILKGKAEITYTLPPWHDEEKTMTVEAGDAYLIPSGADFKWNIFPGEPLRKMCVVMPAQPSYFEVQPKTSTEA
jgi:hypothetical protein